MLLKEIGGTLNSQACQEFKIPPSDLILSIQNMSFSGKDAVKTATYARNQFKIPEALAAYRKVVTLSDLNAEQKVLFTGRVASLELEEKMLTRAWVNFMPSEDLAGWVIINGDWKRTKDYLECKSGSQGLLIYNTARLRQGFEIRGEIEFVSSTNDSYQAVVIWGLPKDVFGTFTSFRLKQSSGEDSSMHFSKSFRDPVIERAIPKKKNYTFLLSSQNGNYDLQVDGNPILSNFSGKDVAMPETAYFLGLGGFYNQNETVVRYRKLEIRQLPSF